jgi:hypothetical protein
MAKGVGTLSHAASDLHQTIKEVLSGCRLRHQRKNIASSRRDVFLRCCLFRRTPSETRTKIRAASSMQYISRQLFHQADQVARQHPGSFEVHRSLDARRVGTIPRQGRFLQERASGKLDPFWFGVATWLSFWAPDEGSIDNRTELLRRKCTPDEVHSNGLVLCPNTHALSRINPDVT